jgi:hypothetical protein
MENIGKFSIEIEMDLNFKGYHFLNTKLPSDSYPNKFPKFEKINLINIDKIFTLRLFVKFQSAGIDIIDSGLIDVKIIKKSSKGYLVEILTLLPDNFPLLKGQNIEIKKEEILYKQVNW